MATTISFKRLPIKGTSPLVVNFITNLQVDSSETLKTVKWYFADEAASSAHSDSWASYDVATGVVTYQGLANQGSSLASPSLGNTWWGESGYVANNYSFNLLDTNGEHLRVPGNVIPFIPRTSEVTVSLWFYADSTNTGIATLAALGSHSAVPEESPINTHRHFDLKYSHSTNKIIFQCGAQSEEGGTTVNADEWHHVVVTVNSADYGAKVYLNGEVYYDRCQTPATFGNNVSASDWTIGAIHSSTYFTATEVTNVFKGKIDEVAFWERSLLPSEVSRIWNEGRVWDMSPDTSDTRFVDGIKLYYRLNEGSYIIAEDTSGSLQNASIANWDTAVDASYTTTYATDGAKRGARQEYDVTHAYLKTDLTSNYNPTLEVTTEDSGQNLLTYTYNPNTSGEDKIRLEVGVYSALISLIGKRVAVADDAPNRGALDTDAGESAILRKRPDLAGLRFEPLVTGSNNQVLTIVSGITDWADAQGIIDEGSFFWQREGATDMIQYGSNADERVGIGVTPSDSISAKLQISDLDATGTVNAGTLQGSQASITTLTVPSSASISTLLSDTKITGTDGHFLSSLKVGPGEGIEVLTTASSGLVTAWESFHPDWNYGDVIFYSGVLTIGAHSGDQNTYNTSVWNSNGQLLDNPDSLSWGVINSIEETDYSGLLTSGQSPLTDFSRSYGAGYHYPDLGDPITNAGSYEFIDHAISGIGVGSVYRTWHWLSFNDLEDGTAGKDNYYWVKQPRTLGAIKFYPQEDWNRLHIGGFDPGDGYLAQTEAQATFAVTLSNQILPSTTGKDADQYVDALTIDSKGKMVLAGYKESELNIKLNYRPGMHTTDKHWTGQPESWENYAAIDDQTALRITKDHVMTSGHRMNLLRTEGVRNDHEYSTPWGDGSSSGNVELTNAEYYTFSNVYSEVKVDNYLTNPVKGPGGSNALKGVLGIEVNSPYRDINGVHGKGKKALEIEYGIPELGYETTTIVKNKLSVESQLQFEIPPSGVLPNILDFNEPGTMYLVSGTNDTYDLVFNTFGNGWASLTTGSSGGSGSVENLSDIEDVTINTPQNNQVLTYNGAGWINQNPGSSVTQLDHLSDVSSATLTSGNYFRTDGSSWSNAPLTIVDDTSPALGGHLDVTGKFFTVDGIKALALSIDTGVTDVGGIGITATSGMSSITPIGTATNIDLDVRGKGTGNIVVSGIQFEGEVSGSSVSTDLSVFSSPESLVTSQAAKSYADQKRSPFIWDYSGSTRVTNVSDFYVAKGPASDFLGTSIGSSMSTITLQNLLARARYVGTDKVLFNSYKGWYYASGHTEKCQLELYKATPSDSTAISNTVTPTLLATIQMWPGSASTVYTFGASLSGNSLNPGDLFFITARRTTGSTGNKYVYWQLGIEAEI